MSDLRLPPFMSQPSRSTVCLDNTSAESWEQWIRMNQVFDELRVCFGQLWTRQNNLRLKSFQVESHDVETNELECLRLPPVLRQLNGITRTSHSCQKYWFCFQIAKKFVGVVQSATRFGLAEMDILFEMQPWSCRNGIDHASTLLAFGNGIYGNTHPWARIWWVNVVAQTKDALICVGGWGLSNQERKHGHS